MGFADWLIVLVPVALIVWLAFYAKRYARSVSDFLAAGRVAGRYVMSVGDLTAGLSVITLVACVESQSLTGFAVSFWTNIIAPILIIMSLTGYCTYRWRETRCLSRGQFLELRYGSKAFRVVTAVVATSAEMITNAIGPAIAANFFIYYLGLPHRVMIGGVNLPCYAILVTLCLLLATVIIWPAGRISLLITNAFQGILTYPVFVIIAGFVLLKFSWNVDIADVLLDRVPGESFLNPYDIHRLRDFNIFALVVNIVSAFLNRAAWFGNDCSNAGRTPHEQKMAGVLSSWSCEMSSTAMTLLAVLTITFMSGVKFAAPGGDNPFPAGNNEVRRALSTKVVEQVVPESASRDELVKKLQTMPDQVHKIGVSPKFSMEQNLDTPYFELVQQGLGDTPEGRKAFQEYRTLYRQMVMPEVLRRIFPVGLVGLFCLLMIMLLISTDDSRIFNSTGVLVQDLILPLYGKFTHKSISPKMHLRLLRLTTVGVALFFLVVALFFSNIDYILMFTTIMAAFWMAGSGPVLLFGLYSRFGNLTGAWCSMIFGSGTTLLGVIGQRCWADTIYPMLEAHGCVEVCDKTLRALSAPLEPWIHWEISPYKFPLNSYEIFFLSMVLALVSYIIGSYLTYKPYDLDKLLHRGQYADEFSAKVTKRKWSFRTVIDNLLTITPEYTKGDKIIAWSVFIYSIVYKLGLTFVAVLIFNVFWQWPNSWWSSYFFITQIAVLGIIGCITSVWFIIGGVIDVRRLFRDLGNRKIDETDNGQL